MNPKWPTIISSAVIAVCTFITIPTFADDDHQYYKQHQDQYISYEKAREIASTAVSSGNVHDLEFDHDSDGDHFDAEVRDANGHKYEVKIDAKSGKILSSQLDD
ncbi:MAG: PepSY domain-containing protein [Cardiobacteriaceae bacterium]|nr:PepSY domain-containing protein [Cardiobacteriaceae bacterium]